MIVPLFSNPKNNSPQSVRSLHFTLPLLTLSFSTRKHSSMPFPAILSNFFEEQWTQNHPQHFSELLQFFRIAVYTAISKKVVGENGERRMSNGGWTTERNGGYAISYPKFHKLRSPCVKINTNYERSSEGAGLRKQKKLTLFSIKKRFSLPRMNGLLSPTLHRQSQES